MNSRIYFSILFAGTVLMHACTGNPSKDKQFVAPGTVVAQIQEPVIEDQLNNSIFSVKVIADSNIANGVYDVETEYGPNFAVSGFTMPAGIEATVPEIRKGTVAHTFVIGFHLPNDTSFYNYYQITGGKSAIRMEYINSYTFTDAD